MHSRTSPSAPCNSSRTLAAELSSDAPHSTWLTAAEAARYLKIKTRTILFWVRSGRIKAYSLTDISGASGASANAI
jgi:helix-turn-helix protein